MQKTEIATLGGGCFWCLEAVFEPLRGVKSVVSGYSGGSVKNPTYREVCYGSTGHAEVVQIMFDPSEISYRDLLFVFFSLHDPTTRNRQGADIGTQYRSIVLYHDEEQRVAAEDVVASLVSDRVFDRPIVTEIVPFSAFYEAESHHQNYFASNPNKPYCQAVIAPKVARLRRHYLDKLKVA